MRQRSRNDNKSWEMIDIYREIIDNSLRLIDKLWEMIDIRQEMTDIFFTTKRRDLCVL